MSFIVAILNIFNDFDLFRFHDELSFVFLVAGEFSNMAALVHNIVLCINLILV